MSHADDIDKLLSLIDELAKTTKLQTQTIQNLKDCIEALDKRILALEGKEPSCDCR